MLLFKTGLNHANKWACLIGVFAALLGLNISGYRVVISRRALRSALQAAGDRVRNAVDRRADHFPERRHWRHHALRLGQEGQYRRQRPTADLTPAAEAAQVTVTAFWVRLIAASTIFISGAAAIERAASRRTNLPLMDVLETSSRRTMPTTPAMACRI
ncbi:hypothetical protein [Streptosporangium roseum]|uniref:hypothetical protein n=1 Tax=Streptosporangium roseum TaxID=2001 RepID=UPI0011D22531|nr:hypothetical protein [Streptosporangium roseum]